MYIQHNFSRRTVDIKVNDRINREKTTGQIDKEKISGKEELIKQNTYKNKNKNKKYNTGSKNHDKRATNNKGRTNTQKEKIRYVTDDHFYWKPAMQIL